MVELGKREEQAGLRGARALAQIYFGKLALAFQTGKFDNPEQKARRMKEARVGMAADQLEFARKYPKAAEILNRHAAEFEKFFADGCT